MLRCASRQNAALIVRSGSQTECTIFGLMSASTGCGHYAALTFAASCQRTNPLPRERAAREARPVGNHSAYQVIGVQ
jgi:hypothetical protein